MTLNGWLIYRKEDAQKNQSYIQWFIDEAKQQQINLQLVLREQLKVGIINNQRKIISEQTPVDLPDFAVVRTIEPMLNKWLEDVGIRAFNSSNISFLCNNKSTTYYEISKLQIPMVDTYIYQQQDLSASPPLPYPFIIKSATGRSGKQVALIESELDWQTHGITSDHVIIQTCDVQLGKDVRVFVIGKEIIGAVLRENPNDFRANYTLGGTARKYVLNQAETSLINKIVNAFDFDLVGIDFLIGHNGQLLFNEIEDVVGSRTLSVTSDINLLEKYVSHIKNKLLKKGTK